MNYKRLRRWLISILMMIMISKKMAAIIKKIRFDLFISV